MPSTMAVLPTPGSPTSSGLLVRRLPRTSMTSSTSRSRPTSGSSLPAAASSVRLRPSCESQGNSRGSRAWRERGAPSAGRGRGRRGGPAAARPRPDGRDRGPAPSAADSSSSASSASSGERGRRRARRLGGAARGGAGRHRHRADLLVLARQAVGEERDGLGAQPARIDAAGGQQLVGAAGPLAGHGGQQVEAVDLRGAGPLGQRCGPRRGWRARPPRARAACRPSPPGSGPRRRASRAAGSRPGWAR